MRPLKLFSLIFAVTLALTLTLPAFPRDTGPVPKTEKSITCVSLSHDITFQAAEVAPVDVGKIAIITTVNDKNVISHFKVQAFALTAKTRYYLQRPERTVTTHYWYLKRSLRAGIINKSRPPNKI